MADTEESGHNNRILASLARDFIVELALLDWTRMGKAYCLAGVVREGGGLRVVRPLLAKVGRQPPRNAGWSAYLLDGHYRWEVFELVGPIAARPEPPHSEDTWVRSLKPLGRQVPLQQRRSILEATMAHAGEPLFGCPLVTTRTAACMAPGTGMRSLVTVRLPASEIQVAASRRDGADEPDFRVTLPVADTGARTMPIKDHHLLLKAAQSGPELAKQIESLKRIIQQMGPEVFVRLGLSRPFQGTPLAQAVCWMMADSFFSAREPQP
jgi:hypothetical protein